MILEKLRLLLEIFSQVKKPFTLLSLWLGVGGNSVVSSGNTKAYLRNNKIDYWIFLENIISDTYGLKNLRYIRFDNIIDIGGNIGLFTISTKKYWPKAKRVIVEPNKNSLKVLKKNLKLNKINAITTNKAVIGSQKKKSIKLYLNENPAMSSLTNSAGKYIKVRTVSINQIIPETGNTLVKIDIEGGEYSLLTKKNKSTFKKIDVLLMETHDLGNKKNSKHVVNWLKKIGFRVYYENRSITAISTTKANF